MLRIEARVKLGEVELLVVQANKDCWIMLQLSSLCLQALIIGKESLRHLCVLQRVRLKAGKKVVTPCPSQIHKFQLNY